MCVVARPMPLAVEIDKMTHFLDEQGSVLCSVKEGNFTFPETKKDLADLFGLKEDDPILDESSEMPQEGSPPVFEEGDEVIVEDVTDQSEPMYQNDNEDLPDLTELFKKHAQEDLNRNTGERSKADKATTSDKEQPDWLKSLLEKQSVQPETTFTPYYMPGTGWTKGKILSWAYLADLKVYAVKREIGIDYFEKVSDLKTLPYFDMHELTRHPLLYREDSGLAGYVEDRLQKEFKAKVWRFMRPQWPKKSLSTTKFRSNGRPAIVWTYKPAQVMKRIPLRKMPQNFSSRFVRWFYDSKRAEATIVLNLPNGDWEAVRVFDPMWLRNLSPKDIETLYNSKMGFAEAAKEQALKYIKVIEVLYAYKPHTS